MILSRKPQPGDLLQPVDGITHNLLMFRDPFDEKLRPDPSTRGWIKRLDRGHDFPLLVISVAELHGLVPHLHDMLCMARDGRLGWVAESDLRLA